MNNAARAARGLQEKVRSPTGPAAGFTCINMDPGLYCFIALFIVVNIKATLLSIFFPPILLFIVCFMKSCLWTGAKILAHKGT